MALCKGGIVMHPDPPPKKLVVIAGGLGNQIQMTAVIATLERQLGWDIELVAGGAPVAGHELREWFPWPAHRPAWRPEEGEFDEAVALTYGSSKMVQENGWFGPVWANDLSKQAVHYKASEVDIAMNACRDLGIAEADLDWHGCLNYDERYPERFDVVIANNYFKGTKAVPRTHWDVRGFPGMGSVAAEIQKRWPALSVCSIGIDDREHVLGTVDRTGLTIGQTLALIKRAKFIVSTDTMAFHAAACFDTPAYVLWTATNQTKSACPKFHDTATLIGRDDLECRKDCFQRGNRWTACKDWKCQEIGIGRIVDTIAEGG